MIFKAGLITFLLSWGCLVSFAKLEHLQPQNNSSKPEIIYLPSGKVLELISFGYKSALAHSLWFNAISYFGKHYREDQKYLWLNHYCNLVTDLAPKARDYYQFCGTILAWEVNDIEAAVSILSKAIKSFPEDWLFYYLRGFTKAFFSGENEAARDDFIISASKAGAHPVVIRLASKKIVAAHGYEEAVEFLKNAIELAQDEATKSILKNRLEELSRTQGREDRQIDWSRNSAKR
jgi:tetratricopeptide (TPR) repeat protein